MKVRIIALAAVLVAACVPPALGRTALEENLLSLAEGWDRASFSTVDPKAQLAAFKTLERQAADLAAQYPKAPGPVIWQGVIASSEAGVVRGVAGFRLVKRARALFEKGAKLNPSPALQGLLYSNLGELYFKVPGFPIGFGDNGKAKRSFERALKEAPGDIEVNFRYAEFLVHDHKPEKAQHVLRKVLDAPPRPGREVGDKGVRDLARQMLKELHKS